MAKRKTNKQLLQKFVREVDDIFLAFVVSELTSKATAVLKDKEGVRESMKNNIIHPDLWIKHNEVVLEYLEQK